jgi:HD-GYP domain-containing protein (c-di-GMP phosphodiesterase class II)
MQTHTLLGEQMLGGVAFLQGEGVRIVRSHHERWDGSGYPDGLRATDIPLEGRLVAVADVYDVLVHERPYKESWTVEAAAEEIRRGAGTQFDPDVVRAFSELSPEAEGSRDPAP